MTNQPLRREFGALGRKVAQAQFGIASIQKQYEELYAGALLEKRGGAAAVQHHPVRAGSES
jgi:hypothetical protein